MIQRTLHDARRSCQSPGSLPEDGPLLGTGFGGGPLGFSY
ncbi:hypothetical protein TVNIR_0940 [Thioalkalivibrio nitratireducens DSM 14787]|uniref:Uncharacterized protein n=1 Tax=Thioalkalivibrio nitratireducens (strain DSM 14787 / UNIQEM 213 / ALEN2) TaxID=1255043 RepID=L0DUC2_THIND|nr:hypothetical protein TVNIR_0940 [Thioalkalivibrio nitratireducens DSM 14787]